jgi:hypothetical protein
MTMFGELPFRLVADDRRAMVIARKRAKFVSNLRMARRCYPTRINSL